MLTELGSHQKVRMALFAGAEGLTCRKVTGGKVEAEWSGRVKKKPTEMTWRLWEKVQQLWVVLIVRTVQAKRVAEIRRKLRRSEVKCYHKPIYARKKPFL